MGCQKQKQMEEETGATNHLTRTTGCSGGCLVGQVEFQIKDSVYMSEIWVVVESLGGIYNRHTQ